MLQAEYLYEFRMNWKAEYFHLSFINYFSAFNEVTH